MSPSFRDATDMPPRLLLADDNADNVSLILLYLETAPYHLETAENGQQAVDLHTAAPFDLIFMDLEMPLLDGYEATRNIRQWEQQHKCIEQVPIVALTAHTLDEHRQRCQQAGCTDFLVKPVRKAAFLEIIARYLSKPLFRTGQTSRQPISVPVQPDRNRLRALLPLFFNTSKIALDVAGQALARGDLDTARLQGHRLKGSALSFGFREIGLAGEALERAADEGRIADALAALDQATNLLDRARRAYPGISPHNPA